jgi:GDP-L-fucose synthase
MIGTDRIFVAGSSGLVGSAIVRRLRHEGFSNLLLPNRAELDLTDPAAVDNYFRQKRPQYVFFAAAKVGGILANDTYPADFIRDNLVIALNVIDAAYRARVDKLLFLGSSCIYPKHAPQPIREHYLLTGELEPTNEPYAVAKIAGIKLCQSYNRQYGTRFISAMPTNLYGPGDNFDLQTSHVLPALLRKFHDAVISESPQVVVWGSGQARREFMHVYDLADACLHLMRYYDDSEIINVGVGKDVKIQELATIIGQITGFRGEIVFDSTKPDGTPRKLLETSKLQRLGWRAKIPLKEGIAATYDWYLTEQPHLPKLARAL